MNDDPTFVNLFNITIVMILFLINFLPYFSFYFITFIMLKIILYSMTVKKIAQIKNRLKMNWIIYAKDFNVV